MPLRKNSQETIPYRGTEVADIAYSKTSPLFHMFSNENFPKASTMNSISKAAAAAGRTALRALDSRGLARRVTSGQGHPSGQAVPLRRACWPEASGTVTNVPLASQGSQGQVPDPVPLSPRQGTVLWVRGECVVSGPG